MDTDDLKKKVMQLALEYRSRIWAFLMGLAKDPNVAEDLFQSTYLVICEKWEQFEPGTNFPAWATKIARYEYLKSVDPSRHRLVSVEMDVLEGALEAVDRPSGLTARRQQALARCLEELAPRSRRAIDLRYGEGLSCRDVARKMKMTLNALYSCLSRVRETLKTCVDRRVGTNGGTA
jgi:RNA polymerase sigma-70 factor (ECF subfamily)